jgi:CubicO group peptidase (beta-lactamase class C family)
MITATRLVSLASLAGKSRSRLFEPIRPTFLASVFSPLVYCSHPKVVPKSLAHVSKRAATRSRASLMVRLDRRSILKQLGGAASLAAFSRFIESAFAASPQERVIRPNGQEHAEMRRQGLAFMSQFFAPALSVAIVRQSAFVVEESFGMADAAVKEQCSVNTLFRIADASKPITSVAIFTLIAAGKMNLTDKVFGASGILDDAYGKPPYKQYVTDITVDNLLTHTCGGWPADANDPMLHNNGWDQTKLITETIANVPLSNPPGSNWAYSNFGYCILGRVIEKVSGQPYANYVQQAVLAPCGITDMQIAGNSEKQRASNEAAYLGQFGENPYKINVTRMDSTAGWIATSTDLAKFAAHVGGSDTIPSILQPDSIRMMTTPSPAFTPADAPTKYARGWMVDSSGNLYHSGSLPGSTSLVLRTLDGMCWGALTNTRSQPSTTTDAALFNLLGSMVRAVPAWNS